MIIFFVWPLWIWTAVSILADVFGRHDVSAWGKAAWTVFLIVLPFLGVLVYLITNSDEMAERRVQKYEAAQAAFDDSARRSPSRDARAGRGSVANAVRRALPA